MDTGAEHPNTYQFLRDIVRYWGINLTCLQVNINPELGKGNTYKIVDVNDLKFDMSIWEQMLCKYGSPTVAMAFCTDRMKSTPFKKYCDDVFGKNGYDRWIGIRCDESKRLPIEVLNDLGLDVHSKASPRKKGFRYLAEISDFTKEDVLDFWDGLHEYKPPFKLNITEHLGNCVFCIKKGANKLALAAKDEPEMAVKWINATENKDKIRTWGLIVKEPNMYRNHTKLSDIIELYKDEDRDKLFWSLKSSKRFESNSCSESCEVV